MSDRERVRHKMAEVLGQASQKVADDVVLTDLVTNSFLLVEMVIELQEEFDVRFQQADLKEIKNVGHLLDLVVSRISGQSRA